VVILSVLLIGNFNSHALDLGKSIDRELLQMSDPSATSGGFYTIRDFGSMWDWLEGQFLTGIYDRGNTTSGSGDSQAAVGYMYGNTKVIGAVRLRQVRIASDKTLPDFMTKNYKPSRWTECNDPDGWILGLGTNPNRSLDPHPNHSLDPDPNRSLDPDPGPDPGPDPDPDPGPGPNLDPDPGPGPNLDPDPGPNLDPNPDRRISGCPQWIELWYYTCDQGWVYGCPIAYPSHDKGTENTTQYSYPDFKYSWSSAATTDAADSLFDWYYGVHSTYGGGGYSSYLHTKDRVQAHAVIAGLKEDWVGLGTRLITVDFTVFNVNTEVFATVRLGIEFLASGEAYLHREISPVTLFRYSSASSITWVVLEMVLYLLILWGIYLVVLEILEVGWAIYCRSWLNILEMLNLGLYIVTLVGRIWLEVLATSRTDLLSNAGDSYVPLYSVSYFERLLETIMAFNTVLSLGRLLKYLAIHPQIGLFRAVLHRASRTLVWLSVVAGILFFAYTLAFHVAYRFTTKKYSTFWESLVELTGMVLGKAKRDPLVSPQPIMGLILYASFVVIIFFIFLKLFITTLAESYQKVLENLRFGEGDEDGNLYLDEDDERWELVKQAAVSHVPLLECVLPPSNVMGLHEKKKALHIKNALEDADIIVHAESYGHRVARMERMIMKIGAAVGVDLVLDDETECLRKANVGEQASSHRGRPRQKAFNTVVREEATLY